MRPERLLLAGALLALAGCVTTTDSNNTLTTRMPRTSKAADSRDAARIHTELGQQYMANGDLQTALEKLTKALQFDPSYAPAHTVVAVLYERIGKLPEAELHYRRAVELEPSKGDANNNLGAFLCKTGRYAEGESYFAKAVADPFYQTPDVAWTNDGLCRLGAQDRAGAEASFRRAVERNPQNGEALLQLANVLYLNNDAFRANAFLQRYDALGRPTPVALKLGHDIESRLGNKDAALNYRRRLQSQFPDSEQAHALDATARP